MSLLRELYEEMSAGATAAGDVAVFVEPLMAKPKRRMRIKKITFKNKRRVKESWNMNDGEFDAHDVLSKLDAAETKSKFQSDAVTFGLEDDQGNVVRVIVSADQAKDFEMTLSRMLGDQFDDTVENYNGTPAKEIAEILFQLKDRFNIIDVKWGDIPTDEDEEPEMKASEQDGANDDNSSSDETQDPKDDMQEPTDDTPNDLDVDNLDVDNVPSSEGSGDETSLLKKVIDMMKTDAEARKAEAAAREAEAKATVSKYSSDAAQAKLKQEEQILDMEAYYKSKKDQEKEAKNLARLAKYKHDIATDDGEGLSYARSEDEEMVSVQSLADAIVQRLKGR